MGTIRQRLLATAVLIALGASACSGGSDKKAAPAGDKKPAPFEAKLGGARSPAAGLRADLTHELQEHVYLSGLTTTLVLQGADPAPAASVLEANTAALGETFATLYDEVTALKFLELWRKKTDLFVRFAQATLAADQAALADVKTQLESYSTDFATFLNGVNPQLPAEGLTTDTGAHVNAVLSAITAQSKNDPLALEKLKDAAAVMPRTGAIYAAGIVKQMTPSFGGTADGGGATLLATLTAALQENVYLLAATTRVVATGADEKKSRETLDENSEGLANLFAAIYGDAEGRRFLRVWRIHVSAVVEAAKAAKAADAAALQKATADLARFRTQLGDLLSSLNPSLPGRAVAADFEDFVAGLLAVVAAQAAADPAEFQRLHEAAATTPLLAELLAGAIAEQFATKFT